MQKQLLGAIAHPRVGETPNGSHSDMAANFVHRTWCMSAFVTATGPTRVSRYRRISRDARSRRGFCGFHVTEIYREVALEPIEQRCLIGVDDATGPGDLDELGLVDLPRRASR